MRNSDFLLNKRSVLKEMRARLWLNEGSLILERGLVGEEWGKSFKVFRGFGDFRGFRVKLMA